jgi:hypothetical protein
LSRPASRRIIDLMIFGQTPTGRRRSLTIVATLFYVLVLAGSAFEHHDLVCHLKNPQHCTACTASQLGADPPALAADASSSLNDAGGAVAVHGDAVGALLTARSTGRSPPTHA